MTSENPKEPGCIAEALIIGAVYAIIFAVIIPLVFGVRISGIIPMMIAAAIAGWFLTRRYRKRMERRLGRKVRGDHELTSISSWMEAPSKDEQPRVVASPTEYESRRKD